MKALSLVVLVFGLVGMSISAVGGTITLIGAALLWPSVGERLNHLTGKRRSSLFVGLSFALVGPFVSSATAPSQEEAVLIAKQKEVKKFERAEKKRKEACSDKTMALIMSQQFVEQALKSPGTARFPSIHKDGVKVDQAGECKFRVIAYVDAQNGFGATIRTRYAMDIERVPDSQSWKNNGLVFE